MQEQSNGYDTVSNGYPSKSTPNQCQICCQQSIKYCNKKHKPADSYWGISLKNDKENSHGKAGCQMSCHTASALPISSEQLCENF